MKRPRKLTAKQGYYVYKNILTGPDVDVIYTTGITGGGGHCYWRIMSGRRPDETLAQKLKRNPNYMPTLGDLNPNKKYKNGWTTLLWTCVPGKKYIGDYTYYAQCPPGIPDWK